MFVLGKKGQDAISPVFVGLVAAALAFVVLVIALSLTGQILETQEDGQLAVARTVNITDEVLGGNVTLAHQGTRGIGDNIDNTTVLIVSGANQLTNGVNYTLGTNGSFQTLSTGGDVSWNISYNFTQVDTTVASNISSSGLGGVTGIGDLVPTMGLLLGIIALLALLVVLTVMFGPQMIGREL